MARILVVDDVKLFRHLEAAVLGWRGYQIEEAVSGEEALEKIRANPPDLVLLDLNMPGMNGHEVCRQLKADANLAGLPVIIVTSSCRDEDIREAVQSGCDDYLTKPIDEAALVRKVEVVLGRTSKRSFPRIPASMQVSFEDFRGIFFEYARDLSRSGVFVEMLNPLPVGTRLRLNFSLPPPFNQAVLAYGRVVRSLEETEEGPGGIGVSFIHVEDESLRSIDAMVAGGDAEGLTEGMVGRLSFQLEGGIATDTLPVSEPPLETDQVLLDEQDNLSQRLEELQKDHLRLSALVALHEGLSVAGDVQTVLVAARDILANLVGAKVFGLFMYDADQDNLTPMRGNRLPVSTVVRLTEARDVRAVLDTGKLQVPVPPRCLEGSTETVVAAVPIPWPDGRKKPMGIVCVMALFSQKRLLDLDDSKLLETMGVHLGRRLVTAVAQTKAGPLDFADLKSALT